MIAEMSSPVAPLVAGRTLYAAPQAVHGLPVQAGKPGPNSQNGLSGVSSANGAPCVADVNPLVELLRLTGCRVEPGDDGLDMAAPIRRLRPRDMLFHEGSRADSVYFVRAGTFKTFRTAEDGYEQVLGFSGRAELIGFDALCMGHHPTACVALEESSVYSLLIRDLVEPGRRVPAIDRMLAIAVSRALQQRNDLADVMAAVAAEARLARFLLQWSARMTACGQSPRRFYLRMGRRDIASYLGLAHETVSRSLQTLVRWNLLSVSNRAVDILDMDGLKALARNTRRPVSELEPRAAHPLPNGASAPGLRAAA
jgi:CRP/FNR family transcriptional regulator, anaerobic regulatory protein